MLQIDDDDEDTLLSVGTAARLCGVHQRTLYRWVDEGRIPSVHVYPTDRVRLRREDVESIRQTKKS
jgi:excisionase family DNA binding protein